MKLQAVSEPRAAERAEQGERSRAAQPAQRSWERYRAGNAGTHETKPRRGNIHLRLRPQPAERDDQPQTGVEGEQLRRDDDIHQQPEVADTEPALEARCVDRRSDRHELHEEADDDDFGRRHVQVARGVQDGGVGGRVEAWCQRSESA